MTDQIIQYTFFALYILAHIVISTAIIGWAVSIGLLFPVGFFAAPFIISGIISLVCELTDE